MNQVFCLGELLIDMVGTDNLGLKDGIHFEKKAGGAPANVCASVASLGGNASFMGQVGNDAFGDFLLSTLNKRNIDTSMCVKEGFTTMAFVSLNQEGERDFTFLRGSDGLYDFKNIDTERIKKQDIIHFGSATGLLDGELKKTYTNMLFFAKENRNFITFDPNYRDTLLPNNLLHRYKKDCISFIEKADLVKLSHDELVILTDTTDVIEGAKILNDLGAYVVLVSLGKDGCLLSTKEKMEIIPSIEVNQIDSTGAGDAFMGAILYQISLLENKEDIGFDDWKKMVYFANIVGALSTTKYGAMEALPTLNEVNEILNK